ncbi:MAG: HAMP domain-containing histidine kinase [Bdellovibrionaceae bacterium]|nr:HAMP domain-containing histidine kinase [Pseudobdellovibrionaceae bacterium]
MRAWKPPLFIGLLILEALALGAVQGLFVRLEVGQARMASTLVGALLRNESVMSQSYLIAQSIEDMQAFSVIQCARLLKTTSEAKVIFYDSTFKRGCSLRGLETVTLAGLDGNSWEMQVAPKIDISFYILKWMTLLSVSVALFVGYRLLIQILMSEKKKIESIETKRIFLANLANQVRHDVASPISALKVIAERAPLDPDTKVFLQEAVQRTEGIFNTLGQFKALDEAVPVDSEILKIIEEKKATRPDFPKVMLDIPKISLKMPRVEFGRMISNLLDNAHESEARFIRFKGAMGDRFIHLHVFDDGKDIPAEVPGKIGQRFNTSGKLRGSGLGLFQSLQFMRSLGGEIKIASVRGEKIILTFPRSLLEP